MNRARIFAAMSIGTEVLGFRRGMVLEMTRVGLGMDSEKRVVEGYLYVYPYAGDDVFIHPEKIDVRNWRELSRIHSEAWKGGKGLSLLDILEELEGRKVRITIERRKITIEILE